MNTKDTKQLQIRSLFAFAKTLGYIYTNGKFETIDMNTWHDHYVSFNNMVRLFNSNLARTLVDKSKFEHLDICWDSYERARERKFVEQVKLQRIKGGDIICQNHKVKLTPYGKEVFPDLFEE